MIAYAPFSEMYRNAFSIIEWNYLLMQKASISLQGNNQIILRAQMPKLSVHLQDTGSAFHLLPLVFHS